ncbi:MAG TPA: ATP synthase F0 subunit C [Clostridiales bacterium]|nr:ATP synthase F0 subunit C [Clostridiales bacterium]
MIVLLVSVSASVFASGEGSVLSAEVSESATAQGNETSAKAIAAALVIGIGSAAGAIAMGQAIGKAVDNIARQPESSANIRSSLTLGLVFIETAIIYALVVAVMIIFVL